VRISGLTGGCGGPAARIPDFPLSRKLGNLRAVSLFNELKNTQRHSSGASFASRAIAPLSLPALQGFRED